jgi:outer membrane biosynthesis protein TonB
MATTFQPIPPPKKSRHRVIIGALLAIVLLGGIASFFIKAGGASVRKAPAASSVINITVPPPLPPPPPPPPPAEPPPPVEQQMIEAEPVVEAEPPPEAKAPDQPPSDLTTNLKGDGPNSFGLAQGNGNGTGGGGKIGGTGSGGTGSKYGRYNAGLARTIESALKSHPATRNAKFTLGRTALWLDASGLITRAKLLDSTGDPDLDRTIATRILPGIRYQPQPEGMPAPINIRITARK